MLLDIFGRVSGEPPRMWGPSIIGFGRYHYQYDRGCEGDAPRTGFSPRKSSLSLYLMAGYYDPEIGSAQAKQLERLGRHETGKSCLYINKLADGGISVLEEIVRDNLSAMNKLYPR